MVSFFLFCVKGFNISLLKMQDLTLNDWLTGPEGNGEFSFPRISMFPLTSSRETLRFSGAREEI